MKSATTRKAGRRSARTGRGNGKPAEYAGAVSLAATAAGSLDAILARIDGAVLLEIKTIAAQIGTLRKEIAKLQPRKMHRRSIPAAGEELDSIVSATESASHRILECAEEVVAADAGDPARYKAFVNARMVRVFEACEFQDLTGQRIAKVIDTLKQIEARVARFTDAARPRKRTAARHRTRAKTNGISQAAIDRIFGSRA